MRRTVLVSTLGRRGSRRRSADRCRRHAVRGQPGARTSPGAHGRTTGDVLAENITFRTFFDDDFNQDPIHKLFTNVGRSAEKCSSASATGSKRASASATQERDGFYTDYTDVDGTDINQDTRIRNVPVASRSARSRSGAPRPCSRMSAAASISIAGGTAKRASSSTSPTTRCRCSSNVLGRRHGVGRIDPRRRPRADRRLHRRRRIPMAGRQRRSRSGVEFRRRQARSGRLDRRRRLPRQVLSIRRPPGRAGRSAEGAAHRYRRPA